MSESKPAAGVVLQVFNRATSSWQDIEHLGPVSMNGVGPVTMNKVLREGRWKPAEPLVFEVEVPMIRLKRNKAPVPPLNGNDRIHWRTRNERTAIGRRIVKDNAAAAGIPVCSHLTVTLHYQPGDHRRRDADNLWPTLKAACDALARGPRRDWVGLELVPDDTPQHMTKLTPVIHPGPGVRRLWLTVEVTRG